MIEIREPKFRVGQKVKRNSNISENILTIKSVNRFSFEDGDYFYKANNNRGDYYGIIRESDYEIYIEKPKTVWDLKKGDTYYVIDGDGDVMKGTWVGNRFENNCRKREIGNIFLTKEEALFEAERRKVEAEMLQLGGRRKMKRDEDNYYISYDEKTGNFAYLMRIWVNVQGLIFFDTYVDVDKAVKAIGEDRIKKYIFGVE